MQSFYLPSRDTQKYRVDYLQGKPPRLEACQCMPHSILPLAANEFKTCWLGGGGGGGGGRGGGGGGEGRHLILFVL